MSAGSFSEGMRVLVVDDDDKIRVMLVTYLRDRGWNVDQAATSGSARDKIAATQYDILLVDQQLPDGTGLELGRELVNRDLEAAVVLMTAYASVKTAVEALQVGLADYLVKPFPSLEFVARSLAKVAETLSLRRRNRALLDELQAQKEELEGLVARDPLTGLYNHGFFHETLERELGRSERHGLSVSVVAIDVDNLESINETRGHAAGDRLLHDLGAMLVGHEPSADPKMAVRKGDIAARYRDDEFALILPHTDRRGAAAKAEAIRAAIARCPFDRIGVGQVTVSAGVATFPDDADGPDALMRAAEIALQAATVSGQNRVCTYTPALKIKAERSVLDPDALDLRNALDESIETSAFGFHFQPILHARKGGVYGFEALVRPTHPALPSPSVLFSTAEHAGRIPELGRVVRSGALRRIVDLPFPFSLFVNLHPYELNDEALVDLAPEVDDQRARIVFEITECSAIRSFDHANRRINQLRERGYRIAIDDLGAGYAGLLALSRLAPDFVKLDRQLVQRVEKDGRTARLVRHVVDFANDEGIVVVAEGIETPQELDCIEELGCGLLQGYLLGRPGPGFDA